MSRAALSAAVLTLAVSGGAALADGVLRVAHDLGNGAASTMDPYDPNRFWQAIALVHEGLAVFAPDGSAAPELATAWSASPDLRAWTFRLREGVTFSDGSTFDAGDVADSFRRMIDPVADSPVRATLGIIESIETPDPLTVVFRLSQGEADFPLLVADYRAMILPEGTTAADAAATPVGTGPFVVEKLDPEGVTRVVRREDYWRGRPLLDAVEVIAVPDSAARLQAILAGDVDFLHTVDPREAPALEAGGVVVQRIPAGDWNAVTFQTDVAPYDDPRVRKALRLAVDRPAMTTLLLGEGGGVPACDTPIWSGDAYRRDADCPPDVAGAKALLAEAGYPDGIDIELHTSDVEENMVQMAEVYQAQVAAAGIRVKIVLTPADGYWDDVWLKVPAFIDSWSQRPATQVLNEVYRSGAAWNASNWNRPDFDALLDAARAEPDFARRKALYGQAQAMLWEEGGVVIPYHKVVARALSPRVRGLSAADGAEIDWSRVDVE